MQLDNQSKRRLNVTTQELSDKYQELENKYEKYQIKNELAERISELYENLIKEMSKLPETVPKHVKQQQQLQKLSSAGKI